MKFDHRVKFNGILYEIGQDVPTEENKAVEKKEAVDEYTLYKTTNQIDHLTEALEKDNTNSYLVTMHWDIFITILTEELIIKLRVINR